MANDIRKHRKLIHVPLPQIMKLLFAPVIKQTYFTLPRCDALPEDATVLGFQLDPVRDAVIFIVCHESFPVVLEGCEPERLQVNWVMVEIARPEGKEKP